MSLTQSEIAEIMDDVEEELNSLSESKYESVTTSEESFIHWLRKKIRQAAHALGYAISLPFRIISDIIQGFIEGVFGSD